MYRLPLLPFLPGKSEVDGNGEFTIAIYGDKTVKVRAEATYLHLSGNVIIKGEPKKKQKHFWSLRA